MLFFNANFICYYFYPTKKREEPNKFVKCFFQKSHTPTKGTAEMTAHFCSPFSIYSFNPIML